MSLKKLGKLIESLIKDSITKSQDWEFILKEERSRHVTLGKTFAQNGRGIILRKHSVSFLILSGLEIANM